MGHVDGTLTFTLSEGQGSIALRYSKSPQGNVINEGIFAQ
jgi:hypothetical protein